MNVSRYLSFLIEADHRNFRYQTLVEAFFGSELFVIRATDANIVAFSLEEIFLSAGLISFNDVLDSLELDVFFAPIVLVFDQFPFFAALFQSHNGKRSVKYGACGRFSVFITVLFGNCLILRKHRRACENFLIIRDVSYEFDSQGMVVKCLHAKAFHIFLAIMNLLCIFQNQKIRPIRRALIKRKQLLPGIDIILCHHRIAV